MLELKVYFIRYFIYCALLVAVFIGISMLSPVIDLNMGATVAAIFCAGFFTAVHFVKVNKRIPTGKEQLLLILGCYAMNIVVWSLLLATMVFLEKYAGLDREPGRLRTLVLHVPFGIKHVVAVFVTFAYTAIPLYLIYGQVTKLLLQATDDGKR